MTWNPQIHGQTNEDMSYHYSEELFDISYKDKTILDLGASIGDAAEFFLFKGAKSVISVEGNKDLYEGLIVTSAFLVKNITPIFMFIESPAQLEKLILQYKPDIVKSDIEGAEVHLCAIADEVWKLVPEYLIEGHGGYSGCCSNDVIRSKCKQCGYTIVKDITEIRFNCMIHAVRN